MYKKLVRYNGWHFAEVDPVCIRRLALVLRDQINKTVQKGTDEFGFYNRTMPFVEKAIRGEIVHSLDLDTTDFISANYRHEKSQGTLPPQYDADFRKSVSEFTTAAQGLSLEQTTKILKDGVTYAWLDFEEEGDWPDRVKFV
jgi:hypothetical protein